MSDTTAIILCDYADCDKPARWIESLHGVPISGGRKYCTAHCMCCCTTQSALPFYQDHEKRSIAAADRDEH